MPRNGESIGDMSEFTQLKERLSCAPFTSHLDEGQEISYHFPGWHRHALDIQRISKHIENLAKE